MALALMAGRIQPSKIFLKPHRLGLKPRTWERLKVYQRIQPGRILRSFSIAEKYTSRPRRNMRKNGSENSNSSAPTGRHVTARRNALGTEQSQPQALKGRDTRRDYSALSGLGDILPGHPVRCAGLS